MERHMNLSLDRFAPRALVAPLPSPLHLPEGHAAREAALALVEFARAYAATAREIALAGGESMNMAWDAGLVGPLQYLEAAPPALRGIALGIAFGAGEPRAVLEVLAG